MSDTSEHVGRNGILRRLDVIEARLGAAARRARTLRHESTDENAIEEHPAERLEAIEATLKKLEEHLRQMEIDMRQKESPPQSVGTVSQFSTGPHFPGLG